MLAISWKGKTNEWVKDKICEICGYELEGVMEVVKKRKFKYFGHIVRGAVIEIGMQERRGRGEGGE